MPPVLLSSVSALFFYIFKKLLLFSVNDQLSTYCIEIFSQQIIDCSIPNGIAGSTYHDSPNSARALWCPIPIWVIAAGNCTDFLWLPDLPPVWSVGDCQRSEGFWFASCNSNGDAWCQQNELSWIKFDALEFQLLAVQGNRLFDSWIILQNISNLLCIASLPAPFLTLRFPRLRSNSQQVWGWPCFPRTSASFHSLEQLAFRVSAPAITSLWPPMNFVAEYNRDLRHVQ